MLPGRAAAGALPRQATVLSSVRSVAPEGDQAFVLTLDSGVSLKYDKVMPAEETPSVIDAVQRGPTAALP